MRIPAYGVIESAPYTKWIPEPEETEDVEEATEETEAVEALDTVAAEVVYTVENGVDIPAEIPAEEDSEPVIKRQGYVAYLEEGDAMAEVTASHGGGAHKYMSVYSTFYPKPTDTYYLTGISTTGSASWNVTSDRKYTGNYTIRVFPMSGDDIDYTDMAVEIRNYLEKNGVLSRITSEEEAYRLLDPILHDFINPSCELFELNPDAIDTFLFSPPLKYFICLLISLIPSFNNIDFASCSFSSFSLLVNDNNTCSSGVFSSFKFNSCPK